MTMLWVLAVVAFSVIAIGSMVLAKRFRGISPSGNVTVSALLTVIGAISFYIWEIMIGRNASVENSMVEVTRNIFVIATVLLGVNALIQLFIWIVYENVIRRRQVKLPRFLFDMLGFTVIVTVLLVLIRQLFDVQLSGILFTSTVASAIIGLALQDTLGNLISGISLQFEAPFSIDEWVEIGGHEGLLVSQNWRTLTLLTRENHRVSLTNRYVASDKIINYSRPTRRQIHNIYIDVEYQHQPELVKRLMIEVMEDVKEVDPDPYMPAFVHQFADFSIEYGMRYWIDDYGAVVYIQDIVLSRLWYVFRREGINFAYPTQDLNMRFVPDNTAEVNRNKNVAYIIDRLSSFSWLGGVLSDGQVSQLAENSHLRLYTKNETIVRQGDPGDSMFIVLKGEVVVYIDGNNGRRVRAKPIGEGDFFGEMSLLTGQPRSAFIFAEEDVEVIEISQVAFSNILVKDPQILELLLDGLETKKSNIIQLLEADNNIPIQANGSRKT
ncbi:MAG: mechanosensitive ion channel family protein, partial [Chloroflexota bacterium]